VHLLIEVNKEDSAVVTDSVIVASQHYFPQSREALKFADVCHSEAASAHIYLHNTFMRINVDEESLPCLEAFVIQFTAVQ
jgi:hypothetical protein